MWLAVTTFLAILAGWFDLAQRYPNREEAPLISLHFQSGSMRGVAMSRILRLEACPSGLRVGIWRLFGPFSRDFFVPWDDIQVQRKNRLFWKVADLRFGYAGNLQVQDYAADRLWRAIPKQWPESGPIPVEDANQSVWAVLKPWALRTALAATFFTFAPRIFSPAGSEYPPLEIAIGFPAVVFGIAAIREFFKRRAQ